MTEPWTKNVEDEAVRWVVRLHSDQCTRADEVLFRAWLERDPNHADAFADCIALWDGVGALNGDDEARAILARIRPIAPSRASRLSRRVVLTGGLGLAAAAAAAAYLVPIVLNSDQLLKTAPGQQRTVRLADGSSVLLNTDTVLRVNMRTAERRLFLDRGQAYFQVARDAKRPFRVFVGDYEVRALGTAFDVRRVGDAARVTLEEGKVAIYRGDRRTVLAATPAQTLTRTADVTGEAIAPAVVLRPGQQVELAPAAPIAVGEVDLVKARAWHYGRMILDDAPLGDTVADLNRYGGVQIVLADPRLAQIRVSGVFHTGRPEDFVESVTAAFPVRVAREDNDRIVLIAR